MFIQNKYYGIYTRLIARATSRQLTTRNEAKSILGYVERHHIIPVSMGGKDSSDNLVFLTPREHFVCHMLLVRITSGQNHKKMIFAMNKMLNSSDNQQRHNPTSHQYKKMREDFSKHISEINSGKLKGPHSEDRRKALSLASKGVPKSETAVLNMIKSWNNEERKQALIARNKQSNTLHKLWENESFRNKMGSSASKRMKEKLSNPDVLKTSVNKLNKSVECEHCQQTMNVGNYIRWHGEKCKERTI